MRAENFITRKKTIRIAFGVGLIALFARVVSAGLGQEILPELFEISPENFDGVRSPALPSGWAASQGVNVAGAPLWITSPISPHTAPNDAFSTAPGNIFDNRLDTPMLPLDGLTNIVQFSHSYDLASGLDGAVLEFSSPSINGGAFTDVTDPAVGGQFSPGAGYNGTISAAFQSPIAGRMAWTGNSGGYVTLFLTFPTSVPPGRLRFRLASDNAGASAGWRVDTFTIFHWEGPSPTPTPPASPTPTPTPIPTPCGGGPNLIADSTFEAGTPWPAWTVQTSTNFGTPLCDTAACGTGGPATPYSGTNWAWFGGAPGETATLGQTVSIMAGGQALLSFEMRIGTISFPLSDVLNVRVDGTIVQSYPEPTNAEASYRLRTIDLGAFADGGSHNILFEYVGSTSGSSTYAVDNVTLTTGACATPTPSPTVTPTATPTATATATIFPTATPSASDCGFNCTPAPPPTATATATPTPTPTPTVPPTPSPTPTTTPPPGPAQALNISTRLRVETGERVMIGGFIVNGSALKKIAIRGVGPSLANAGLSDVLADPILELRGPDGALIRQNDNWQDDPAQAAELTNLGLALTDSRESGIVATLNPGAFTAIIAGKNQTSGVALVEIYDADAAAASRLANISTRGFVQSGENVMIGGFILGNGSESSSVAVRGLGPSLSQSGLNNVLADPTLELRDSNGALLIANDNWQDDPASAGQLIRFGLFPVDPKESAIFTTLPPGAFTAILAGKGGAVGLGLVEIYNDVHADTLTVTSTADSGVGSLRDTIAAADNGDMIQFDAALTGQTINVTSGELVIDKNITISGPGPDALAVLKGNSSGVRFRVFHVMPGHTVTIAGIRVSGGDADLEQPGGGIFNDDSKLTISHCDVSGNDTLSGGGGIYNGGAGAILTIFDSTVSSNRALGAGSGNTPAGCGIFNNGTLKISNSNISNNRFQSFPFFQGIAGGIFNAGAVEISNSTISGNVGGPGNNAIINRGSMLITNSTFSTFSGPGPINRDGGIFLESGSFQVGNSILQAEMGVTIFGGPGTVASLGYNLSSDNGGGFLTAPGDQINTDPMLGPLQDNGGPTFTHALLAGSPAINAGDPNFAPPPSFDQRGFGYPRVIGGRIDIGAFELQP